MSLGLEPSLSSSIPDESPRGSGRRRRWEFWRSPEGQPVWARPTLLGIASAAAVLFSWNLPDAGLAPYYSVAVKSMSVSWQAFFYGAFDPGATITLDKLAGSFLPQALSARIFGFHPWALALPQAIEGVVSVLVMYRMVRRWRGAAEGLLAAGILAFTPITASMFGHSMEDGALTMCLVLAADAWQSAVRRGNWRPLLWCGVWVGLGFQAKMLQAWMILPALAIGYLVSAPGHLGRRIGQLAVAGTVMLTVSLSWIALYTFTPAESRPYVDGSTSNNAVAMAFGYNGLVRFGVDVPGAVLSGPGIPGKGHGAPPGGVPGPQPGGGGSPVQGDGPAVAPGASQPPGDGGPGLRRESGGWAKLVGSRFGSQIGWLYPLALLTLVGGFVWRRRKGRTDGVRAGLVMWGSWLVTFALVYSAMSDVPHTAYVASLAPPLAALSAAGIVLFWGWYRTGGRRAWVMPVAVVAVAAWAMYLWSPYPDFLPWVHGGVLGCAVAAVVELVLALRRRRTGGRVGVFAFVLGVVALLAAPVIWSGSVLDKAYAGSSFEAGAGPSGHRPGPPGDASPEGAGSGRSGAVVRGPRLRASTTLSENQTRIFRYVTAHGEGATYAMAVQGWRTASPYILATGQKVLPMGGFSGQVPVPTLTRVRELVDSGRLKFFLLRDPRAPSGRFHREGSEVRNIANWVRHGCAVIPPEEYGGSAADSGPGGDANSGGPGGPDDDAGATLYRCGTG